MLNLGSRRSRPDLAPLVRPRRARLSCRSEVPHPAEAQRRSPAACLRGRLLSQAHLRVTEIFYSIQGESSHAGRACIFVRLSGCPLRCNYCDTAYAFDEGGSMSVDAIVEAVQVHPTRLVLVTGGEPLAQPAVIGLMQKLLDSGYEVLLETSGAFSIAAVPASVRKILDLKTPDSGEEERNEWTNLELLQPHDEVKFVIQSRRDYEWARDTVRKHRLHQRVTVLFSPEWGSPIRSDLARWILDDALPVRYQLQLHKLIWPGVERGV
ncbi:MAG: 7-carboxy-7-deazaguanine synthase QueE [Candidatus Latescibacterota bacterium]|nr:MAG: 7-carboxy-7-deazaguanine synthase QueE [Candidatus Latescibacterota bacterium]